jgi:tripartite-type tricarboxylate transporter receptor subunit TctC
MTMHRRSFIRSTTAGAALAALGPAGSALAQADKWPNRAIRFVVTFTPGGSSDLVARILAGPLAERLGQQVVVENRPGAGGTIGAAIAADAAADGYTFLVSNAAPISLSPFIYSKVAYDPLKSFNHFAFIGSVPTVAVVPSSSSVKTFADLVAFARNSKDPLTFGSSGIGSVGHMIGEFFQREFKVKLNHIPYKGSAGLTADLLGGQVQMSFDTLPQMVPHLKTGALRGLAVTSPKRQLAAPDVPSVVELGFPRLEGENWIGLSAPAATPAPILATMNKFVNDALMLPDTIRRFDELAISRRLMSPAEFDKFVRAEVAEYGPVLRAAGIKVE